MESSTSPEKFAGASDPKVTMRAVAHDEYGSPDVLEIRDIPRPVPGHGEVLVRVRAASVQPLDWHLLRGKPYLVRLQYGLRRPKRNIPGADLAGTVEAIGEGVTLWDVGDEVFGEMGGACAEFVAVAENLLTAKPATLSFEEAAAVPVAGFTALQGLRDKGRIRSGQSVLINGASGGVGTLAVQIAKSYGAVVTGVCSSRNVDLVRSLGADHVIDYTREDYTRTGEGYDLILDTVGSKSLTANRRALKATGTYVSVGSTQMGDWIGPLTHVFRVIVASIFRSQHMKPFLARADREDLEYLSKLIKDGEVRPVIDRSYSLAEVPDAIRYVEEGHARGKVVISIP